IGVAPAGFFGTELISSPELFFPLSMQGQLEVGRKWLDRRDVETLFVQGRLKPDVNQGQAQAALNLIAAQLEREYPDVNENKGIALSPPGLIGLALRGPVLGFTGLLMAIVGLVLLLACTNLANLLLARTADRRREIAVRLACGASRFRIVRQLLTESLLLALGAAALGLLPAIWFVDLVMAFRMPVNVPLSFELFIDYRVLGFTLLLAVATGVLFGLLPALQATKPDVALALKADISFADHKRSRLKSGLIVLQIALSLVLLVGGALMIRALEQAQSIDIGFNQQHAVEVAFDLRLQGYESAKGRDLQKLLLQRARTTPGVKYAGLADMIPIDLHFPRSPVFAEGQPLSRATNAPIAMYSRVSPGYFEAMGTRFIKGRDFSDQDDDKSQRVA